MTIESRIIPISGPSIRWDTFLKDTSDLIGHGLTRRVDASGLKLSDYAKFIAALGELQDSEVNPIDTLRNSVSVLHHLHFSFLIIGSTELILKISESKLHITSTKVEGGRIAMVSGTLGEWKAAVVELSTMSKFRGYSTILLEFFHHIGLQYIFANYKRKQQQDGNFLLEYKAS